MIGVLLVDDHALMRAGFRALIEREGDMAVVGEAGDGEEAVSLVARTSPDIVLMDISMPGLDGIEATRRILAAAEDTRTRVLLLTTFETSEAVHEGVRSGASGFMLKDSEPEELLRAIRIVAAGDALLSPRIARRLLSDLASGPQVARSTPERLRALTTREREVMGLVATGLTNDAIAERLVVSRATAKTHVSRAMRKLQAHDRAQLVALAYELGLVRAGVAGDGHVHEVGTSRTTG